MIERAIVYGFFRLGIAADSTAVRADVAGSSHAYRVYCCARMDLDLQSNIGRLSKNGRISFLKREGRDLPATRRPRRLS